MTTPALAQLIERIAGLTIERGGMSATIDRHVGERMRALGLRRVEDYVALAARSPFEQRLLIEAVTVRHTWFFRDPEQLDVIAKLLVAATSDPISVWVAGCATGEEAYTIAMIGRRAARNVRVLATDVNESALAVAHRGVYGAAAAESVPEHHRHWLVPGDDGFAIDPRLRSSVSFERHNLVDLPPRGEWDLVVCRNVLIYFAQSPSARVHERFALAVRPGGSLILGAGEIVVKPPPGFEMVPMGKRLVLRRSGGELSRTPPPAGTSPTPPGSPPPGSPPPGSPPPGSPPPGSPPPGSPSPGSPPPPGSQRPRSAPPATVRAQPGMAPGALSRPPIPAAREPAPAARDEGLAAALGRGHALFERGETSAAIAVYAELAASHASVAEVWLFLGIARYAQGDMENAAVALRASHCLDEGLWPAVFYLWRALERTGHHAEARRMYELLATNGMGPIELQSVSAMINELRAFQHDFQTAGRLATERASRAFRDRWPPRRGT